MNHYVPGFEMDDDCSIATTSAFARPKRSAAPEDAIMELSWQNGQVVMHSQAQKSLRKYQPSEFHDALIPAEPSTGKETRPLQEEQQQHHLLMQEDEMAAWLHYPLHDSNLYQDFSSDLLYRPLCVTSSANTTTAAVGTNQSSNPRPQQMATASPQRPPVPPACRSEVPNFSLFSTHNLPKVVESRGPSSSKQTVVRDSSITPAATRNTGDASDSNCRGEFVSAAKQTAYPPASGGGITDTRDKIVTSVEINGTSSRSCSTASADFPSLKPAETKAQKRKGREGEEAECGPSEDVEIGSVRGKKQARGSTSTKRSRAAEVHNLSERKRRDRINEKMKALRELIPRCNKSDKASMLDEAIEYLKSLQLQVQMMSMGCGMVPIILPGVQQYVPPMGMGMGMGVNQPLMPFPGVLAGSALPTPPAAATHLAPRFSMSASHMPPVPTPDPSRVQAANSSDPNLMLKPLGTQHMNGLQIPNISDPYRQYLGLQPMQLPVSQSQAMAEPSSRKPRTSRGCQNIEGQQQSGA